MSYKHLRIEKCKMLVTFKTNRLAEQLGSQTSKRHFFYFIKQILGVLIFLKIKNYSIPIRTPPQ